MKALRTLVLQDMWSQELLRIALKFASSESQGIVSPLDYYIPIHRDLEKFLAASTNLTTLTLCGIDLWIDFFSAISRIKTLHEVTFLHCRLEDAICLSILHNKVCAQESILNLRLALSEDDSILYSLGLYPQLRTLTFVGPTDGFVTS